MNKNRWCLATVLVSTALVVASVHAIGDPELGKLKNEYAQCEQDENKKKKFLEDLPEQFETGETKDLINEVRPYFKAKSSPDDLALEAHMYRAILKKHKMPRLPESTALDQRLLDAILDANESYGLSQLQTNIRKRDNFLALLDAEYGEQKKAGKIAQLVKRLESAYQKWGSAESLFKEVKEGFGKAARLKNAPALQQLIYRTIAKNYQLTELPMEVDLDGPLLDAILDADETDKLTKLQASLREHENFLTLLDAEYGALKNGGEIDQLVKRLESAYQAYQRSSSVSLFNDVKEVKEKLGKTPALQQLIYRTIAKNHKLKKLPMGVELDGPLLDAILDADDADNLTNLQASLREHENFLMLLDAEYGALNKAGNIDQLVKRLERAYKRPEDQNFLEIGRNKSLFKEVQQQFEEKAKKLKNALALQQLIYRTIAKNYQLKELPMGFELDATFANAILEADDGDDLKKLREDIAQKILKIVKKSAEMELSEAESDGEDDEDPNLEKGEKNENEKENEDLKLEKKEKEKENEGDFQNIETVEALENPIIAGLTPKACAAIWQEQNSENFLKTLTAAQLTELPSFQVGQLWLQSHAGEERVKELETAYLEAGKQAELPEVYRGRLAQEKQDKDALAVAQYFSRAVRFMNFDFGPMLATKGMEVVANTAYFASGSYLNKTIKTFLHQDSFALGSLSASIFCGALGLIVQWYNDKRYCTYHNGQPAKKSWLLRLANPVLSFTWGLAEVPKKIVKGWAVLEKNLA
ncbi:MAG: hypothetical protein M1549_02970 [Candidatus Dependentiae bacterium]|nr:hypothetical protein [Candidatus Dependentiae bacterium]